MQSLYRFRLLRYAPNRISDEFYNVAVLLYDGEGRLLDARFAPDFVRLRCNPLADVEYLHALRGEFEDRRLAGEGFSRYVTDLVQNQSQALHVSEERAFLGGQPLEEVERLVQTYLVTPRRGRLRSLEAPSGTRRWVLARMRETFRAYQLTEHLQSDVAVGPFVSPRFSFQIDYAYRPNGLTHYLHALSARHDVTDASRLCFVFDRIRLQTPAQLTAVVTDAFPPDTHELLDSSHIRSWPVSKLEELAREVQQDLGLP